MQSPQGPRVLVVDDDPALRELLSDYLGASGFTVDGAADGVQMRERMAAAWPDLLVLDLMLPGEDGLSLARDLRRRSDLPILMLSARGEEIDRVIGLEVGADDYLAKPFGPRELLARLRALLRRAHPAPPLPDPPHPAAPDLAATRPGDLAAQADPPPAGAGSADGCYRFGPFQLDPRAWRLTRDGAEVPVTSAEFALLRLFVQHPQRVLSRDDLIEWLKGYERDAFDRSIDSRVTRLRRKIEPDPARPVYIRTVRGEGYLFNPRGEAA
ncbi:MAG TPA: response regulator [Burkholderiaceae bacterium]|nr:response regulator [Burkholderiaceae bacterium]